jgi:hypothetical protein
MKITDDNLLLNRINNLGRWLDDNKLYGNDPCDFICNNFLGDVERLKKRCGIGILDRYSVYSVENYFPRAARIFIKKHKSAVSSALFVDGLLNMDDCRSDKKNTNVIARELDWIAKNRCKRYRGYSWGLPFDWVMGDDGKGNGILAKEGTPYSTLSIYPVNAFIHAEQSGVLPDYYSSVAKESKYLFTHYLKRRAMTPNSISLSYSPLDDFYIVNVNSYAAATLCKIGEEYDLARCLIQYVLDEQLPDGSWNYWGRVETNRQPCVDSLHQVYIMQNLLTCYNILKLPEIKQSIVRGLEFFVDNFIENGLILKFPRRYKDIYVEEHELIDISESLSLFIEIVEMFPKYSEWVDIFLTSILTAYSSNNKYLRTKIDPKNGVDIPFIRWGQSQAFFAMTKYYKIYHA